MDDIAAFIAARADELEAAAKSAAAASAVDWHATAAVTATGPVMLVASGEYDDVEVACVDPGADGIAAHIALNDPAHSLAVVKFIRLVLSTHTPRGYADDEPWCEWCSDDDAPDSMLARVSWPCPEICELAAIWNGHSGYLPGWGDPPPSRIFDPLSGWQPS